jgi:uncharacterized protein involved in outer membrane biogenesis
VKSGMRRTRKILICIGSGVILLVVVVCIAIAAYDWNRAKPWLGESVGHAIGRSVSIDGDLGVSWQRDPELRGWRAWIPGMRVRAANVVVGNADWAKTRPFATLRGIEFDLAVLPLLLHTVSIPSMHFIEPSANFERMADGRDNWTIAENDDNTASSWHMDFGRIAFDQGEFTVLDRQNTLDAKLHVETLKESMAFDEIVTQQQATSRQEAIMRVGANGVKKLAARVDKQAETARTDTTAVQRYAFNVRIEGTFKGLPVQGNGKIGGVFALKNPDRPFPIHADVRIGDTRIAFVGTLVDPTDLDALDLRLWLSGKSLAQLYDILKITLPDSPPYATEGHLIGRFTAHDKNLRYENFSARIGSSDLGGDLLYETKLPRPLLSGKVVSDLLQFRDLAPLIGAGPVQSETSDKDAALKPADKVLPVEPFRPERWQKMDADVRFTGDRVFRDSELPIHKVDTRIVMDNAVLSLDPLKFRLAFGDVTSSLRMDGRTAPIKATLKLNARAMQLARIIPAAQATNTKLGQANVEANLQASGDSIAALLGVASGELKLVLDRGTISKALVETAGLNVPNIIVAKLFGDKQVDINCAAADFVATSGVLDARLFLIDTDIAAIDVTGKINLASEQLDLTVHPNSKGLRLLSLRSPIHIQGPFKQPDVSIDKGALILRGAGAVALGIIAAPIAALLPLTAANIGGDDDNRCAPLLAQMQHAATTPNAPTAPITKE